MDLYTKSPFYVTPKLLGASPVERPRAKDDGIREELPGAAGPGWPLSSHSQSMRSWGRLEDRVNTEAMRDDQHRSKGEGEGLNVSIRCALANQMSYM